MTRGNDFSSDCRFNDAFYVCDVRHHEAALRRSKSISELLGRQSGLVATNQVPERHVT
jgi:hypothetical protein